MSLKMICFSLIVLFTIGNCFPAKPDSTNIQNWRYFCGSTVSSYGPLIIAGTINLLTKDKEENGFSYHDTVPDIRKLIMIYHFGFGGYFSLSSIAGLTVVGHQKGQIISKCLLFDLVILASTLPFYFVPHLTIIPVVAVLAIPIINYNIAYKIDNNHFQSNIGKISVQPYCGFKNIKTVGVLIRF